MARIAYIDHSYHKKTLSTKFLSDILEKNGHTVDWFWDESWHGGESVRWEEVQNYDSIVMFQSFIPIFGEYYINKHPCVTYIPMLDQFGIWNGPLFNLTSFWEQFQGAKVLNFSSALHCMTTSFGIKSKFVRYFQEPIPDIYIPDKGLHGFLWIRREDQISWKIIKELIANTHFDSFHIHATNDPGSPSIVLPSQDEIKKYNITISTWFDEKSELDDILRKSNVFFASRMEEGIGQSFLEALNRAQCVIAPNNGTMNEYIIDGVTGLLYDTENPQALNFSNVLAIGIQGKQSAEIGYQNWKNKEKELVEFILAPNISLYDGKYYHVQKEQKDMLSVKNRFKYFIRKILAKYINLKIKLKNI